MFKSIYTAIIANMQISLGKVSGWIVDSVELLIRILVFKSVIL